jgi:hypothetical protein
MKSMNQSSTIKDDDIIKGGGEMEMYENDSELRDLMNKSIVDPIEHDQQTLVEEEEESKSHEIEGKKKKKVLYSDKSESSIDENMHDTPSNYNIPNGRLDGKSLGLKA